MDPVGALLADAGSTAFLPQTGLVLIAPPLPTCGSSADSLRTASTTPPSKPLPPDSAQQHPGLPSVHLYSAPFLLVSPRAWTGALLASNPQCETFSIDTNGTFTVATNRTTGYPGQPRILSSLLLANSRDSCAGPVRTRGTPCPFYPGTRTSPRPHHVARRLSGSAVVSACRSAAQFPDPTCDTAPGFRSGERQAPRLSTGSHRACDAKGLDRPPPREWAGIRSRGCSCCFLSLSLRHCRTAARRTRSESPQAPRCSLASLATRRSWSPRRLAT